jgi:hypothetical protein
MCTAALHSRSALTLQHSEGERSLHVGDCERAHVSVQVSMHVSVHVSMQVSVQVNVQVSVRDERAGERELAVRVRLSRRRCTVTLNRSLRQPA